MKAARRIILSAAIVLLTLFLLQRLLVPKYATDVVEGAFVAEYYQEKNKDFDVIFVGDCEVYENFSPVTLWEKYGIHSYIRGSAEQYVWQSYYLLEDTLRYHTPKVVIFNIQAMQFNESQNEAYNRMTLEGMEWSMSKVNAIFASLTEKEQFLDYVFPILRYHTRWSELTTADVQYLLDSKPVSHNGYYMRVDVKPAENVPGGKILADYSFEDKAWNYLPHGPAVPGQWHPAHPHQGPQSLPILVSRMGEADRDLCPRARPAIHQLFGTDRRHWH